MQQQFCCPQCSSPVIYNSKFCSHCGLQLTWQYPTQPITDPGKPVHSFNINITGESFQNEDGSSRQEILKRCKIGEPIQLIHSPHPKDKYAVRVYRMNGEQIGYIPKYTSIEFATIIQRGIKQDVEISEIKYGDYIGCWLKVTRYKDDLTWNEKTKLRKL